MTESVIYFFKMYLMVGYIHRYFLEEVDKWGNTAAVITHLLFFVRDAI